MKLETLIGALGGTVAHVFNTASTLAIIIGAIYLVDCRITARSSESMDRCYFQALPLMGIGAAGRGGFQVGFQTFNPALRPPESENPQARDSHGRFTRKDG